MHQKSYQELKSTGLKALKIFTILFAGALIGIWVNDWYKGIQDAQQAEVYFTNEDVVEESDVSILKLQYPISCTSSNTTSLTTCEELYYDQYAAEGWKTKDDICYKEFVTFDFSRLIYLEFITLENFFMTKEYETYDKIKEVNIVFPNKNIEPITFEMELIQTSQWIDINQEVDSLTLEIKSSYNSPENTQCGLGAVAFYGRDTG